MAVTCMGGRPIGIEIWLPLSGWNGRFLGTGNGGYPSSVDYRGLLEGVRDGFAVANTDMGLALYDDLAANWFSHAFHVA
jgi:Tannase and feruloyl esterase